MIDRAAGLVIVGWDRDAPAASRTQRAESHRSHVPAAFDVERHDSLLAAHTDADDVGERLVGHDTVKASVTEVRATSTLRDRNGSTVDGCGDGPAEARCVMSSRAFPKVADRASWR